MNGDGRTSVDGTTTDIGQDDDETGMERERNKNGTNE